MYKIIHGFVDVVEKRNYREGDEFIVGPKTDDKRIAQLSGNGNAFKRPLIEKVEPEAVTDEAPVEAPAEAPAEVEPEAVTEVKPVSKPANKTKSASKGE